MIEFLKIQFILGKLEANALRRKVPFWISLAQYEQIVALKSE